MAQKPAGAGISGGDVFRALIDFLVLTLLVVGAGFGGYYWGIHERLATVQNVPPGTPGALPVTVLAPAAEPGSFKLDKPKEQPKPPDTTSTATASTPAASTQAQPSKGKLKFWITSSGVDYTGNNITVTVNDNPVDNFYGPGKSVDISRFVKHGDNTVSFEAKALGDKYNKHRGDKKAELKVQVISGTTIQENFKPSDVLATYKRNATENEDAVEAVHFTDGD